MCEHCEKSVCVQCDLHMAEILCIKYQSTVGCRNLNFLTFFIKS
jgi:hypothetical protein